MAIWGEQKNCKNPFPAILRLKNPTAINLGGGTAIKKITFYCGFP